MALVVLLLGQLLGLAVVGSSPAGADTADLTAETLTTIGGNCATVYGGGGTGTFISAMSDTNDGTYIANDAQANCYAYFQLSDLPAPATTITSVSYSVRHSAYSSIYVDWNIVDSGTTLNAYPYHAQGSYATSTGAMGRPGGGAWSVSDVNNLRVQLTAPVTCDEYDCYISGFGISEFSVSVVYSATATTTTTAPAATTTTTAPAATTTTTAPATTTTAAPNSAFDPVNRGIAVDLRSCATVPANTVCGPLWAQGPLSGNPPGNNLGTTHMWRFYRSAYTTTEPVIAVAQAANVSPGLTGAICLVGRSTYGTTTALIPYNEPVDDTPSGGVSIIANGELYAWRPPDSPSDSTGCIASDPGDPNPPPPTTTIPTTTTTAYQPGCSNGADDDVDGFTDYPEDPGCSSVIDPDESGDTDPPPWECQGSSCAGGPGQGTADPGNGGGNPDECNSSWWNPLTWGNLLPCALAKIIKWIWNLFWELIKPDAGDFDPLFAMWDDVNGKGIFALADVVGWPAQQVLGIVDGVEGGGTECLVAPGPPGQQGYELFCADDASTGWRATGRSVALWGMLAMFAIWLYHFAMGVIKR